MRQHDPRHRYRVALDAAAERGELDPREVAVGESLPWNRYLLSAEMCERPPEEWERVRPVGGIDWCRLRCARGSENGLCPCETAWTCLDKSPIALDLDEWRDLVRNRVEPDSWADELRFRRGQ